MGFDTTLVCMEKHLFFIRYLCLHHRQTMTLIASKASLPYFVTSSISIRQNFAWSRNTAGRHAISTARSPFWITISDLVALPKIRPQQCYPSSLFRHPYARHRNSLSPTGRLQSLVRPYGYHNAMKTCGSQLKLPGTSEKVHCQRGSGGGDRVMPTWTIKRNSHDEAHPHFVELRPL